MDNHIFIRTGSGHSYVYSDVMRLFTLIPPELQKAIAGTSDDAYYRRKAEFLKVHRFFDKEKVKFKCDYPQELIIRNLANLRQLLIEVTDRCNLKCKYCGYGEFYSNYDQRETKNQTFDNVKILVDYLVGLWTSPYNVSYNKVMDIGFYGGEPLLNMPLIRETIAYVERLQIADLRYAYNMTTNAVLLDHYMDYLVKKDFSLLISLDGGEYQDSYRVDKHGNASFPKVVANVKKLQQTYPDYFEKKVRFNAVLHDRNSVEECYRFIHDTFGKIPRTAALNVNGIIPERRKEFAAMFNDELASTQEAMKNTEVKEALKLESADARNYHGMLRRYLGNYYSTYCDLLDTHEGGEWLPTGTCRPFERKLFLTVNGKILPCEKMGQEHAIAYLKDGKLDIDTDFINKHYARLYEKVIPLCSRCNLKKACRQCLFFLKEKDGKLYCNGFQTDQMTQNYLAHFLTYAEEHPEEYEKLLSTIVID